MKRFSNKFTIFLFLLPALSLYLLFVLYPVVSALFNSFYRWRGMGGKTWIGLEHYKDMLEDENFINSLIVTGKYIVFQVPIALVISLTLALLISNAINSKLTNFYRSSIFFPFILPAVAVAMLWGTIYNPVSGLLNGILEVVGLEMLQTEWLGRTETAFGSVLWVSIWNLTGFYTVLFLAGILNIPQEVLEAAEIDGANKIQKSIYVMIPMLKDVSIVVITFVLISTLKIFELPQLLTNGGPNRSTEPVSLYMYEQAFSNFKFGYASAIGVVFFIIVFIITMLTLRVIRGEKHETA